jgi:hypothetical protein
MKLGRNDPCPCGSGKKYKKCCLADDREASLRRTTVIEPSASSVAEARSVPFHAQQHPKPIGPAAPAPGAEAPTPPLPTDPVAERAGSYWSEFQSQNDEGRIGVFLRTLEDAEVITDDLAFEMLSALHADAVKGGARTGFAECVCAFRELRPDVFDKSAHYYLSWCLLGALAESREQDVRSMTCELATRSGRDIDIFNCACDALAYHGQLHVLVEAMRIAWPLVKSSGNVVPWGISEFAEKGVTYEIFNYLEQTGARDPADPVMLERVGFFDEGLPEDYLSEMIGDLTGASRRQWRADDFALKLPRKKRSRDDWDDEEEERPTPDQGAVNLFRLITEFVGYLRREEGVPFPRGELVRQELDRYFARRNDGDLDPRPSMLEQALHPNRKLPKPPRPAHPLCPERVTLEIHLCGLMSLMNGLYHSAAALFQAMPAWLRFLESRRLIDASTTSRVAAELAPLHGALLPIWEKYTDDPLVYRQGQEWLTVP